MDEWVYWFYVRKCISVGLRSSSDATRHNPNKIWLLLSLFLHFNDLASSNNLIRSVGRSKLHAPLTHFNYFNYFREKWTRPLVLNGILTSRRLFEREQMCIHLFGWNNWNNWNEGAAFTPYSWFYFSHDARIAPSLKSGIWHKGVFYKLACADY